MNRKFFITGTDTNVGKSFVTAALMTALQERGIRCAPVKPVQSGTAAGDDDIDFCTPFARPLFTATERQRLNLFRLPLPASPHLAAREAGIPLSVHALESGIRALSNDWDVLLIEGAGGLLVPLNGQETMLDLIKALDATLVVVARDTLGTLNHTLLTLRVLENEGLVPAAVVLNSSTRPSDETDRLIRSDNEREIARRAAPVPVIAFPRMTTINLDTLRSAGRPLAEILEKPGATGRSD